LYEGALTGVRRSSANQGVLSFMKIAISWILLQPDK
jgi:hypothetical protein